MLAPCTGAQFCAGFKRRNKECKMACSPPRAMIEAEKVAGACFSTQLGTPVADDCTFMHI